MLLSETLAQADEYEACVIVTINKQGHYEARVLASASEIALIALYLQHEALANAGLDF